MKKSIILILSFVLFLVNTASAQQDSLNIKNYTKEDILKLNDEQLSALSFEDLLFLAEKLGISIDDILNKNFASSTKTNLTQREAPGIVSVITAEDIKKVGFRNLIDILQTVPGFNFGYDIDGTLGISERGNWGQEGKILLLIDGQEYNEGLYSTVPYANQIPVEQIESIEIIRGPGSSLYGGYAELGVINIKTKSAKSLGGTEIFGTAGSFTNSFSRGTGGINFGKKLGNWDIDAKAFLGSGKRSNSGMKYFSDTVYNLNNKYSDWQSSTFNVGIARKNLHTRFIYDDYFPKTSGYGKPVTNSFANFFAEINYKFKISDKFELTPVLNYKNQKPYQLSSDIWTYKTEFSQYRGGLDMIYKISQKIDVVAGISYKNDEALTNDTTMFYTGKDKIDFQTSSFYVQGTVKTRFVNFFAGTRYDNHTKVDDSFSPRVGLTKAFKRFHFKILQSYAFRMPSIENINLNQNIKPEKTVVSEFETGIKINDNMFFTANLFNIIIKNPILYYWNPTTEIETYMNYSKTGTKGAEFEFIAKYFKWSANLSYSYYTAENINEVVPYKVEYPTGSENVSAMKGNPQHKFTVLGTFNFTEKFSASATFIYLGERYGYMENNSGQSKQKATLLSNICLSYQNLFIKNFGISFGVYNVLNEKYEYLQPAVDSNTAIANYPAPPIEFILKLNYWF